ncbi:hypothetical protein FRC01_011941, partial [Tulasnella sp. 417]
GVFTSGPSSLELLSILASCPNLTYFRLLYFFSHYKDHEVANQANVPPIVVELASLQNLTLESISSLLARDLLSQLRFPDNCTVSVRCTISNWSPAASFLDTAFSRYRDTLGCAGETGQFTISVVRATLGLIAEFRLWRINLNLGRTGRMRDVLGWFGINTESDSKYLGSLLETSPVDFVATRDNKNPTPITLDFINIALKSGLIEDIASILDLRCINKIKATSKWCMNYTVLLSYLSAPSLSIQRVAPVDISELAESHGAQTHNASVWPLPGLHELVFTTPEDCVLRAVIDLVKGRSGDSIVAGALGRPERLKRIEFLSAFEEVRWDLLFELLDVLDDDAEVLWLGKRVYKQEL